jgi:hypothetical protein
MRPTTQETALQFIQEAKLPPLTESVPEAAPKDNPLQQAKDQATVVGSDVISFVSGVTAEQRQDLINCALLAQLVAKVQVSDATKIYDWYQSYFDVLKQIGWVVQEEQFATYRTGSMGLEAHEAIIALATTLLGASPAALAVVKATLDSLKSMSSNSPWLTIFNRESQSGKTARFQVTLAEPDGKGQFLVTLMAFGLDASSTLTQVLFFKFQSSEDVLKHFSGKVSIDSEVLAAVRDEIRKKLAAHVTAYVRTLPDLDVPRLVKPTPPTTHLESSSPLIDQVLNGVTDEAVADAAGFREDPVSTPAGPELEATPLPTDWKSTISPAGYQFIVRWETGGQDYYEKVIKGRPEWPGYSSGVTIGCGWDLGYHGLAEFRAQWSTRLSRADFDRLVPTVGFRTIEPNRATKVAQAKALVRSLSDIVVPWTVAIEQFDNVKYPALIRQLYQALDNLGWIHPHCRAALLSLTFNRGPAFSLSGPRYLEMHSIGDAMRSGTMEALAGIPDLIRSMKRLWGSASSLSQRREGEALLFEAGLKEMRLASQVAGHTQTPLESALEGAATVVESMAGSDVEQTDDADVAEIEALLAQEGLEAAGLTVASVRWNPKDDEQPDYRHLDTSLAGASFDVTCDDLDLLIKTNEFAPLSDKLVFALRGASLGGVPKRENVTFVPITDQRPDHREFRCIIGVYDRSHKTLSAYQASTVPNAAYVFKCYAMAQAGTPISRLTGNILPTGCYTYTVGPHHPGTNREIPTVLRLAQTASDASPVVVLRSISDTIYDRFDPLVTAVPADNVHPGQMSRGFSSAGCLTLPGFYSNGQHTGIWKDFRTALGLGPEANGTHYSLMLLTGLDAGLATHVRAGNRPLSNIQRLRHGSTGPRVAALQSALGISTQANPILGPSTRQVLVSRQVAKLGWSDGIYSPDMDQLLGLGIYGTA